MRFDGNPNRKTRTSACKKLPASGGAGCSMYADRLGGGGGGGPPPVGAWEVEEAVVCKICKAASWRLPYEHGGGGAVRLVCLRIQVEDESSDFFFFQSAFPFFLHYN
jgi:hypothetical protein